MCLRWLDKMKTGFKPFRSSFFTLKFGVGKIFLLCLSVLCLPRLHLLNQKYSKNSTSLLNGRIKIPSLTDLGFNLLARI